MRHGYPRNEESCMKSPPKLPSLPVPSVLLSSSFKAVQQLCATERSNTSKSALRDHYAATIRFRDELPVFSKELLQPHNSVPPLHLHPIPHKQLIHKERVLDPRSSLPRKLVNSILQLIAKTLNHVAADEEPSPAKASVRTTTITTQTSQTYLLNP
jgi:hypothetical protein